MGRLQSCQDADCLFFQKVARQGHYKGIPGHSQQGIYAVAPSGLLLGSLNSHDPVRVAGMLDQAMERWDALSREERLLGDDPDAIFADLRRAERSYPEDGFVLRVYSRDLPRDNGASSGGDWVARAWNQEYAWFTKAEARQFLPETPETGQRHEVPWPLVSRIARCHLVDNVRGETSPFKEEEIERARLTCEVTDVSPGVVSLRLEGESRTSAEGMWTIRGLEDNTPTPQQRGFDARLEGTARFDLERGEFIAFDLVAVGDRWGGTRYNVRSDDLAPAPMGVYLTLAGRGPSERVAPAHFRAYGWDALTLK